MRNEADRLLNCDPPYTHAHTYMCPQVDVQGFCVIYNKCNPDCS